ncbi:MAG: glycosyltransferase family 2 protein [Bacteroidota bacterium]|nr:glycosyltransferase family 2 protein [Bacteroidota bacterium]
MIKPILSICIATYNRGDYIGETLDSIIPQLTEEIELLVVDGASTDNTEKVMQDYLKKSNRLRYVRLPVKGGVDQDYDTTVELAHGEWCWLFTDDDLFKPGAIAAVLNAIKKNHSLIVVNAEMRNQDLSTVLEARRIVLYTDKIYDSNAMERFFIDVDYYLSFIGAVVIRRSIWLSRDRKSYYGTEFIHVGVIFQEPLPETAVIIAEPYITIRYGNAQWSARHFDIWMFKWPKLLWSFKHISAATKLKVSYKEPWRKFRVLIYQRSIGYYNPQLYRQYLSPQQSSALWKFCAFSLTLLPVWICKGLCEIYFFSKRVRLAIFKDRD